MLTAGCICLADDAVAAKHAIQQAGNKVELVDESHFMAALRQCSRCGQHFLTLFCERIDWTDGDDPQAWLAVPITPEEVQRLRTADVASNENVVLAILANERRFLFHDMPKGAPQKLAWQHGALFIPVHD